MPLLLRLLACAPATVDLPADAPAPAPGPGFVEDAGLESVEGPAPLDLFADDALHVIGFELSASAWSALRRDPREPVEALLQLGGEEVEIGLRLKGSSTMDDIDGKPSFKLDFDFVHEGRRVQGLRSLNLHNLTLDPILSSEWLTYGFFREAGLPAPRVGYARVSVDGEDYGLYSIVEDVEDELLAAWFLSDDGNLYENAQNYCDLTRVSCFDREEDDEGDDAALERLIEAANTRGGDWLDAIQSQMHWDRFIGFLAMERAIAHWDSYSFDQSNYRLYHDPGDDTWTFIPWSADLGFGYRPWSYPDCGRHGVDPDDYDMGMLAASCEQDPTCAAALEERTLDFAALIEDADPGARVDAALARVRPEAATDPDHWNELDHFDEHGECVRAFLVGRPAALRARAEGAW